MARIFYLSALLLLGAFPLEAQRPQDPQRPYPYAEEVLFFDNPRAPGVRLAATLTMPRGEGPFAAAVLVSGSGQQDRNEALEGHRPFLVLADYLTRRGLAVLRYDDRGSFQSTGDFINATTEDLATDALAAVEYLAARPEIDPGRVGVIGHSEGGLVAPMVAVQSEAVAFIVLLAGPGMVGEELMYLQQSLLLASLGADEASVAFVQARTERFYAVLKTENDRGLAEAAIRRIWDEYLDGEIVPENIDDADKARVLAELAALSDADKAQITRANLPPLLRELNRPWWPFFLAYDPRPTLSRVRVPVLAINGDKDLQVPAAPNLEGIAAALEEGGNPDFQTVSLPGLNHLFQTAETGAIEEYAQIEETFAPEALELVGDWVAARTAAPTAVFESRQDGLPAAFLLGQNHPNPFNGQTLIPFALAEAGPVELALYNGLGQRVATLASGWRGAGNYSLHWDGRDDAGRALASGLYHYRLRTRDQMQTRQLLMLR